MAINEAGALVAGPRRGIGSAIGRVVRPGVVGRLVLSAFGPLTLTLGLFAAALAVPLIEQPDPPAGPTNGIDVGAWVSSVAFGPDGQAFFADCRGGQVVRAMVGESGTSERVDVSSANARMLLTPSGDELVVVEVGGPIQLLDPTTLERRATLPSGEEAALGLAMLPDGRTLVTADVKGLVRLWDLPGRRLIREARLRPSVTCCDVDPGGRWLALGRGDGTLSVVGLETFAEVASWRANPDRLPVVSVQFAPEDRALATLGVGDRARLWEVGGSWRLRRALGATDDDAYSLALSPDGALLATGHEGGQVRWWDTETGAPACAGVAVTPGAGVVNSSRVTALDISPDGGLLAVACAGMVQMVGVPGGSR